MSLIFLEIQKDNILQEAQWLICWQRRWGKCQESFLGSMVRGITDDRTLGELVPFYRPKLVTRLKLGSLHSCSGVLWQTTRFQLGKPSRFSVTGEKPEWLKSWHRLRMSWLPFSCSFCLAPSTREMSQGFAECSKSTGLGDQKQFKCLWAVWPQETNFTSLSLLPHLQAWV